MKRKWIGRDGEGESSHQIKRGRMSIGQWRRRVPAIAGEISAPLLSTDRALLLRNVSGAALLCDWNSTEQQCGVSCVA
jgi:hypothetical protein